MLVDHGEHIGRSLDESRQELVAMISFHSRQQ